MLAVCLAGADLARASYPLTDTERERLAQYIPRTFAKLQRRDPAAPVHIVALGDSVTRYVSYDGHENDSHRAYHGVFAAELAREFFYTGGVRDVEPTKGNPEKATPSQGPEITLRNLGMGGKNMLHGLSRLTTDAYVYGPDLVLINFGINDGRGGAPLPTFTRALRRSVEILKERGVDVILLGPSVVREDDTFEQTARTMIYGDAVRAVAAETGVLFVSLADVTAGGAGIDPMGTPEAARAAIFADMGRIFEHGSDADGKPIIDALHPAEAGHRAMGKWIFEVLMHGSPAPNYKLAGATVTLGTGGNATVDLRLKNLSPKERAGYLLALPNLANLAPGQSAFPFDLGSRKDLEVRLECKTTDPGDAFAFPGHEGVLRLPFFIADGKATVPMVVEVPVMPVNVVWKYGLKREIVNALSVEAEVVNYGTTALAGSYEGAWAGQKVSGNWTAPPGGTGALALSFRPPAGKETPRLRDDIRLTLKTADGTTLQFRRGLEVTRNVAIWDTVKLARSDLYLGGGNDGIPNAGSEVSVTPMADKGGLYLTYRLSGVPLVDTPENAALAIEVNLDARLSKEGRSFGFTDAVRVQIRMDSPEVKVGILRNAIFGDGYDRAIDSKDIPVSREVLPGGGLQIVIKIPRSYLYLHEWALGNGNSILGFSTRVYTLEIPADYPEGVYTTARRFVLNEPDDSPHSSDSLLDLELDLESTGRWTARLY